MKNPLANFDLELFLENFPDAIRQPMPLAIAASVVAHGVFFVGLPVVTGASDEPKKPDRVVNVIELSPAEQAKLPQSSAVSQVPLPLTSNGTLPPLAGLTPTPLPSLSPINPFLGPDLTPNNSTNNWNSSIFSPPLDQPDPIIVYRDRPTPTPSPSPSPSPTATPSPSPTTSPTPLPSLNPGQEAATNNQPTPQPSPTTSPSPGGAGALANTQPAATDRLPLTKEQIELNQKRAKQAEEQQKLIVATTYNVVGTTDNEQEKSKRQTFADVFNELKRLGGNELVGKAIANYQAPEKLVLTAQPVPPGWNLNFGTQAKADVVQAIVQVYLNIDGQSIQTPAVTRSSGFKGLDAKAVEVVVEDLKKTKRTGKYQAIEFTVPFNVTQPANM